MVLSSRQYISKNSNGWLKPMVPVVGVSTEGFRSA